MKGVEKLMSPQCFVQLLRGAVSALEDISAQWKVANETQQFPTSDFFSCKLAYLPLS
jgi:hypothetical protein